MNTFVTVNYKIGMPVPPEQGPNETTTATGTLKINRCNEFFNNSAHTTRFSLHFLVVPARLRREMTKLTWERERKRDKFYHLGVRFHSRELQPKCPSFK